MAGRKRKRKTNSSKNSLMIIGAMLLSILLTILIYSRSGVVGEELSDFLGGMIGWLKYVLPIGAILVCLNITCRDNQYLTQRLTQYCVFVICIAILMSAYQVVTGELNVGSELGDIAKQAYDDGTKNIGGGAIGAIVAVPLAKLIGGTGAMIASCGIAIMLFVFAFGIDISEIIRNMVEAKIERSQEKQEERRERRLAEKEERQARATQKEVRAATAVEEPHHVTTKAELKELRKREKEEQKLAKKNQALEVSGDQIKINLNGRIVDEESEKLALKGMKKYNHSKDDLVPLGMEGTKEIDPEFIESNLFKQEEEKKEDKTKEVLQLEHAVVVEDEHYEYPPIELLSRGESTKLKGGAKALTDVATKLQKTLYSFGVQAKVENVSVGPAITRYELKPAEGVRVSKIANLADDIALNLAAETIRIEAPIPGKQAVGIEVPNQEKETVHLRDVLETEEFQNSTSKLAVALGKDVAGNTAIADISKMPHALIAGATGSGKSVCINTIITSIIYKAKPSEVKLVMIDPKVVELSVYNGIPHLLIPVVTDPKKAAGALAWAVQEMDNRYNEFAKKGVRDLKGYNKAIEKEEGSKMLPQIVIIIDELADLMMVAAKDVEDSICRLAQKARAAGMYLIIATQRPSVDVITGIIKANVPSRIAFAVSSQVDSRTILDQAGAEKLLGKGDMLFYPTGSPKPSRIQGAFVSDDEVEKIVDFIKSNGEAKYSEEILESIENGSKTEQELVQEQSEDDDTDPFLWDAIETVVETGQASTSFIQRRFKVGYARAGRIIDQMEERGVISGYQGSKPREVLMTKERLEELKMGTQEN